MPAFAPDIQLNWLARYVPLRGQLQGACVNSLLEVGSGARGLGCILATPFVGIDIAFQTAPVAPMLPFVYDGALLPFKSGAFHTTLSMDSLEHVPPTARPGFLLELARVSASRVIMGCPVDAVGQAGDRFMQRLYAALNGPVPDWLFEHDEQGLPASRDIELMLDAIPGWRWSELPTTGGLAALLLVLADVLPGMAEWVQPVLLHEPDKLAAWIEAGNFGPMSRRVYMLEREAPSAAIVALDDPDSLVAGLACPDCGGDLDALTRGMACLGCQRHFAPDAMGVWPFKAASLMPIPGADSVVFTLAPDWLRSTGWVTLVHNYLNAFGAGDDVTLRLQVDPDLLSAEEALALLQPVLAPFGQMAFAALDLSDDPHEPLPMGRVVTLPTGDADAVHWSAERFRIARQLEPFATAIGR